MNVEKETFDNKLFYPTILVPATSKYGGKVGDQRQEHLIIKTSILDRTSSNPPNSFESSLTVSRFLWILVTIALYCH